MFFQDDHRINALNWIRDQYQGFNLIPPQYLGDGVRSSRGFYTLRDKAAKGKFAYSFDDHDGCAITVTFLSFKDGGFKTSQTFTSKMGNDGIKSQPHKVTVTALPIKADHPTQYTHHQPLPFSGNLPSWLTEEPPNYFEEQTSDLTIQQQSSKEQIEAEQVKIQAEIQREYDSLEPAVGKSHAYLTRKGVVAYPGLKIDKKKLIVPAFQTFEDWANGKVSTYQKLYSNKIEIDGSLTDKLFRKGGLMSGSFFPIGLGIGVEPPIIYLCEGYATGATIFKFTNLPTIVAFNAGNLLAAAQKIREQFPHSQIINAGDDDKYKELEGKGNAGRSKASLLLSRVTNLTCVFPDFRGLNESSQPTDFNDLHCLLYKSIDPATAGMRIREQLRPKEYNIVIKDRFVPNFTFSVPIIALQTPMGTGKTQAIVESTKHALDNGIIDGVIVVTSRISLIESIKSRFAEKSVFLHDYRTEAEGPIKNRIVCVNSVDNISIPEGKYALVLDETEQSLSQLAKMEKKGKPLDSDYNNLRNLILRAEIVIAADANLGYLTKKLLNDLRGNKEILYITSSFLPGEGRKVNLHKKRSKLYLSTLDALTKGVRFIVVCDSSYLAERFHSDAKKRGIKGIAITKHTKNDDEQVKLLQDINQEIEKYQYLVYSPAISGGVSIDASHGFQVVGFFSSNSGPTPEDAWQQLGRYRGACDYHIHVKNRINNKPTTVEGCLEQIEIKAHQKLAGVEKEQDLIHRYHQLRNDSTLSDEESLRQIKDMLLNRITESYTELQAQVTAKENSLRNNYLKSFVELATKQGYEVVEVEEDDKIDLKAAHQFDRKSKEEYKTECTSAIVNAKEIDANTALVIERNNKATSLEQNALEKYRLKQFYGKVTEDIVADDDCGRLRAKINRLSMLGNPEGAVKKDIDEIIDILKGETSIGNLEAHKMFVDVYLKTLDFAGYTLTETETGGLEVSHNGEKVTSQNLLDKGFIDWVNENYDKLRCFHTVPKDVNSKPMFYLNRYLDDLGLRLKGTQEKGKKNRGKYSYLPNNSQVELLNRYLS